MMPGRSGVPRDLPEEKRRRRSEHAPRFASSRFEFVSLGD
jgi:hypothetical protein